MTILLTGGTGKTGAPLARRLSDRSTHTILLASRKGGKPMSLSGSDHSKVHAVKFDWFDRTSWTNPFEYMTEQNLSKIDRIYLIAPDTWEVGMMNDFIDFAREKGVNRFLFLSATQAEPGDPSLGQVHAYLEKLGTDQGVQWIVVRPTWFIENLREYQIDSIKNQDTIFSVWGDGKVPFVSAEDISELVYERLSDWKAWNYDVIIHGSELFTNDQVAELLSTALGRTITHTRITEAEYIGHMCNIGFDESFARGLVDGELRIAQGSEEAIFRREGAVQGVVSLREYVEKNKHLWMKS